MPLIEGKSSHARRVVHGEPVEAALNDVVLSIGLPVEGWWSPAAATSVVPVSLLVGLLRDGLRDAPSAQKPREM